MLCAEAREAMLCRLAEQAAILSTECGYLSAELNAFMETADGVSLRIEEIDVQDFLDSLAREPLKAHLTIEGGVIELDGSKDLREALLDTLRGWVATIEANS